MSLGAALFVALWAGPVVQELPERDERHTREAPGAEGALDNDVFVTTLAGPERSALEAGDRALARARAAGAAAEQERQLDLAFDGWRAALDGSPAGARLWLAAAADGEARTAEGLVAAVRRRLVALAPGERARYVARVAPAARAALEEARRAAGLAARAEALARTLRLHPATPPAASAALELGDLALEAGRAAEARAWYERAALEDELSGGATVAPAAQRRLAAQPAPEAAPAQAWTNATGMVPRGHFRFEEAGRANARTLKRRPRPGAAWLGQGRFVVQTASELLCFGPGDGRALAPYARVQPLDLLEGALVDVGAEAPREPPGWPLLPLAEAEGVVLVCGRALTEDPNALVALTLAEPTRDLGLGLDLGQSRAAASLRWAWVGAELVQAGTRVEDEELLALLPFEFQPGPVASGDLVVVQLRTLGTPTEAWLAAFRRHDGALVWLRFLARGADRIATGRMADVSRRVAAQPLLALDSWTEARVFAGTHLGLGVQVDALDGELTWSFKNRRRPEREAGWNGDQPIATRDGAALLWQPMDSDRLYVLRSAPVASDAPDGGLLLRPPVPLAEARLLHGGEADEQVVSGASGRERTLSARRAGRDRVEALDLGPEEEFRGVGRLSPTRAWVATDRELLLFDRTRELYLLEAEALPPLGNLPAGGDVHARDDLVLVLGPAGVWRFQVR